MKRIDENTFALSKEEFERIESFIEASLDASWDRYTDQYICEDTWEDGMKRMNPEMFDMMKRMQELRMECRVISARLT